jgi:hypothetical protein
VISVNAAPADEPAEADCAKPAAAVYTINAGYTINKRRVMQPA